VRCDQESTNKENTDETGRYRRTDSRFAGTSTKTTIEVQAMDDDSDRISLLGKRLGPQFQRRVITIAPGHSEGYVAADWHDAIVVVEHGQIELELMDGSRACFPDGAILPLSHLPLRRLHNPGSAPAVLAAVSRRPN
jgi:hypothetical protein